MKRNFNRWAKMVGCICVALAVGITTGCDDSDYDRDPPPGLGSLVVDNSTSTRVRVYLDGERVENVSSGEYRYYDLEPGTYRLVLDGTDTNQSWAGDVDVLTDRLTVVEIRTYSGDYRDFDIRIYFD